MVKVVEEREPLSAGYESFWRKWSRCDRCPLADSRTNIVLGEGNLEARIVLVGEAPGRQEDEEGIPFIGRSGKILDKLLEVAHVSRDDLYITNAVACRPPDNRQPNGKELAACWPRLQDEIYQIDPDVLILSGAVAVMAVAKPRSFQVTRQRGIPLTVTIDGRTESYSLYAMPTFHPAYLMRNYGLQPHGPVHSATKDIRMAHRVAMALQAIRQGGIDEGGEARCRPR